MTPGEFDESLARAVRGLMITHEEAQRASDEYRKVWREPSPSKDGWTTVVDIDFAEEHVMQLQPGKFYVARDGSIWCCYRVNKNKQVQAQADCVCVDNDRLEYFFIDGRYDSSGRRELTLIKEVPAPT